MAGFACANPDLSINAEDGRQLDVQSSFDKGTISGCNSADLDSAITQLVYCKGLPFSFAECPYFKRMLEVARCAPRGYKPPKKDILGGEMLDLAYKTQLARDIDKLLIIDCTARLLEGEKKDGAFISSLFIPVMEALDVLRDKADIVLFDGGSSFQLAGRIIQARFPRITVKRLCRTFGSGSNHRPHAYFMSESKSHNNGRAVGLLRSAETGFASFFLAMQRPLCCRRALESTVHSAKWTEMKRLKPFIVRSADDLLRFADSNKPNMDVVCFYVNRARIHLMKSKEDLMNEELFPSDYSISKETEQDATYDSDSECDEEESAELVNIITEDEEDLDVYEVDDEWDIVADAKVRIDGNGPVRNMIEDCVRRLLSDDVDGALDGTIDRKVDLFWDELNQFHNR
eukprot:scaffold44195_cov23-Cyclotella_meneghiniana.AAC.1